MQQNGMTQQQVDRIIQQRYSCRTFAQAPLPDGVIKKITRLLTDRTGPFGAKVRFCLMDKGAAAATRGQKLSTYGIIKGARWFIAGAVRQGIHAMEDYGFCLEHIILELTAQELATCWLGASYKRSAFARMLQLQEAELLPAVTPVGFAAAKPSLTARVVRFAARARKRKPWHKLFFADAPGDPLSRQQAGLWAPCLENVRLAPSASNRQPWRIIHEAGGQVFHFYMQPTPGYDRVVKGVHLQRLDMGIAMLHFQLSAQARNLPGTWVRKDPAHTPWTYIVSWQGRSA